MTSPHVLVLAPNSITNDARISKQIASLVEGGYTVTVLATAAKGEAPSDTTDDRRHIYRIDEQAARQAETLPASLDHSVFGALSTQIRDAHAAYREAWEVYAEMRRAGKTHRVVSMLSALTGKAKAKRKRVKQGLLTLRDAINEKFSMHGRLFRPTFFHMTAETFIETSPLWAARLADKGPPKVVHGHDLFTAPTAVILAEKYGAAAVYDAHEYEPERNPPLAAGPKALVTQLEDQVIARANAVITVSDNIADLYRARRPGLDMRLIYNCPEIRGLPEETPGMLRAKTGLAPDIPIIAFVGVVTVGSRGLQVTLDALQKVPKAVLVVIGPRRAQADAELRAAAEKAGLTDRLMLLDPVKPNEVVPTIADATASVCLIQDTTLSYRFAMPNKLFEAALAGVPIIGSDLPDIGGFIRRFGVGEVVDQTDPEAIASGLAKVIANPAGYRPDAATRAAMVSDYSWAAQERKLLELYGDLGAART
jgi:glycosyltransferase involved in cell wall biosynthesis